LSKIKYAKKIKVPSALAFLTIPNIMKKIKIWNKTSVEYHNILSYLLSKGNQRNLYLEKFEKKAFRNARVISECLIKKNTNIQGIKYQKHLETLKIACNMFSWQKEGVELLKAITNLANLKFIFLSFSSFSEKEMDDLFKKLTNLRSLEKLKLSVFELSEFWNISGEKFNIQKIEIDFYRGTCKICPLLKVLTKIQGIQEITITSKNNKISEICNDLKTIEDPLSQLGISLESFGTMVIKEKPIVLEESEFTLRLSPFLFSYINKK